jgi:hypothetical protein
MMALSAHGQLVLSNGQTWDYSFSSLPLFGFTNAFATTVHGEFGFTVNASSFQAGEMLAYDMFENSASEAPICSGTMTTAQPNSLICSGGQAWQDLQGVVRFRMLSGSVTVDNITLRAITPSPSLSSYWDYETSFTPVPEPGTFCLLVIGVMCVAVVAMRRQRLKRSLQRGEGSG